MIGSVIDDLRFALRQLRGSPGYTLIAVLTLALGIGVNATAFTLLNTLLFKPAPFGDPSRLVLVYSTSPQSQFWEISPAEIQDILAQNSVFEGFAALNWWTPTLTEPGQPAERLKGLSASEGFLSLLKVTPAMGRLLTREEERDGSAAVISNRFWQGNLGGDPHAIGRILRLDGKPITIVGVMPPSVDDSLIWGRLDLWGSLGYGPGSWSVRDSDQFIGLGRLKSGTSVPAAQAQMNALAARLSRDFPATNTGRGLNVVPLESHRVSDAGRHMSWLLMGLTLFVLVIACMNLANLQLLRASARGHQLAIRMALGSSRLGLMRLLVAESLIISFAGGAAGILFARIGNFFLGRHIPWDGVMGIDLPLDANVLAFTTAAAFATAIGFGAAPALISSRINVNEALKRDGHRSVGSRLSRRFRRGLVVAEIALSLALMAGAGYFAHGTYRLVNRDLGWRPNGLLVGRMVLPEDPYANAGRRVEFYNKMRAELGALPGVDQVLVSTGHPSDSFSGHDSFLVEGQAPPPIGMEPLALHARVSPGFFATMGTPILEGREFDQTDRVGSRGVVVINEAMAKHFWPSENPIGKKIGTGSREDREWREVVGVVGDVSLPSDVHEAPETPFQYYWPIYQNSTRWLCITVRCHGDPRSLEGSVRTALARIDPNLVIYSLETARERIGEWMASFTLVSWVLVGVGALGLLLSAIGIYGVIASSTAERTREIGIRMALGAQRADVLCLVLKEGLWLAMFGMMTGLGLAFALTDVLAKRIPEVPGQSLAVVCFVSGTIVAIVLFASWFPALGATKLDPIETLRAE